jgi:hypothetical protein
MAADGEDVLVELAQVLRTRGTPSIPAFHHLEGGSSRKILACFGADASELVGKSSGFLTASWCL